MGQAIPYDIRVKIISRLKTGEKADSLAKEFGYTESGIKKLWYKYKKEGAAAYKNNYGNCGQKSRYSSKLRSLVKELRDNEQGACYICSKLAQKYPDIAIPSERTLQRWWVKAGTNRRKGRPKDYEKKVESDTT